MGLLTEPVDVGRYAFCRMQEKDLWGVLVRGRRALGGPGCGDTAGSGGGSPAHQRPGNRAAGVGQLVWGPVGKIAGCGYLQPGFKCGQHGALRRGGGFVL